MVDARPDRVLVTAGSIHLILTPEHFGGFMFLRSSWISPGILDNSTYPERRLFSFS